MASQQQIQQVLQYWQLAKEQGIRASEYWLVAVPLLGSIITGLLFGGNFSANDAKWYKKLQKPRFNPPKWVFPIVWPVLYTMIGYAMHLVWNVPGSKDVKNIIPQATAIGVNLLLNYSWSIFFFKCKKIGTALVVCLGIFLSASASAYYFYSVNRLAGQFLIPYCVWTFYATILNLRIYLDNKPVRVPATKKRS